MRILHLIASFGPGGAERQLSLLAPALARSGVETHVAYRHAGPNLARLENGGAQLHALEASGNHNPALAWTIWRLIRRLRPDVVQTWLLQMDVLGGHAALLGRVPLIVSERSSASAYPPGWKTRLRLQVGKRATCIVANSLGGLDYWRPHVDADRLHIVRNCVSPSEPLAGEPVDEFPPPDQPLVLYAGRFSHEKNIPCLVEALILVARRQPDAMIILFGEGPEREGAARRIAAEGLGQQIVVRDYSRQLPAWLERASACVSVSHFEGHPNVVMEAASAGCPLVLSDIPAHRELFNERSAAIVPAESPALVADAVLETLCHPASSRERAARAQVIAAQCDLDTAVSTYRTLYQTAAARGHATP
jgi:glycosyltransferase involved in cell wall biosynthesis